MTTTFGEQLIALLPRLRRFAISLTGARDRADDLVQTACARALAAQDSYADGTRFDSWMFRILRNCWIDGLRRQKIEGPQSDIADHDDLRGEDGEQSVMARMTLKTVMEAIGLLPEDQRDVLLLVCVEDFSYAETADMLGVPIGTVMSRLARAREKIMRATGIEKSGIR